MPAEPLKISTLSRNGKSLGLLRGSVALYDLASESHHEPFGRHAEARGQGMASSVGRLQTLVESVCRPRWKPAVDFEGQIVQPESNDVDGAVVQIRRALVGVPLRAQDPVEIRARLRPGDEMARFAVPFPQSGEDPPPVCIVGRVDFRGTAFSLILQKGLPLRGVRSGPS